jgi:hypothetical protein
MRKAKVALSIFWAAILLNSFLVMKKLRTGTFSTFVNSVFQGLGLSLPIFLMYLQINLIWIAQLF